MGDCDSHLGYLDACLSSFFVRDQEVAGQGIQEGFFSLAPAHPRVRTGLSDEQRATGIPGLTWEGGAAIPISSS